ncbi:MAG: PUA domain-containing protein [Sulfolobaceae archaeon]
MLRGIYKASNLEVEHLLWVAEYQFDYSTAECLILQNSDVLYIQRSPSTKKIRYIYIYDNEKNQIHLYLILRAQDYLFSLTLLSANGIKKCSNKPKYRVIIIDEAKEYISKGYNVFAKHVIEVDRNLRPGDEVIVVDKNDELIGFGRLKISGEELLEYKRGVAVNIKRGVKENGEDYS